jgi:hypothetical protein
MSWAHAATKQETSTRSVRSFSLQHTELFATVDHGDQSGRQWGVGQDGAAEIQAAGWGPLRGGEGLWCPHDDKCWSEET